MMKKSVFQKYTYTHQLQLNHVTPFNFPSWAWYYSIISSSLESQPVHSKIANLNVQS